METGAQQPQGGPLANIATPTFSGSAIPGVPQSAQPDQRASQILDFIKQLAQRKQMANTAVPQAIPPRGDLQSAQQVGMNTGNPHAWGTARFLATLGASMKNAVATQKQNQVLKAEGDWTYLQASLNELYAAQQSGDQQAIKAAQAKVDATLGDPKKLKAMAKALNQDWLQPEKTTVYGEALKRVTGKQMQQDQKNQQKQQAAQQAAHGLKGLFQKLIRKATGPQVQLTDDERQRMAHEIQAKAPITQGITDPKQLLDIEKASREAREQYAVITSPTGEVWAYNKSNPKDAFRLKDAATGKEITGQTKTSQAPKVVSNKGVPYAVTRGGETVTPESPNWTKQDQTLFDAAVGSAKEAQQLRIDPIVADEIGAPPNPKDYGKGRSDPEYAKALGEYGKKGEQVKNRMAAASGATRAMTWNEFRPVQALNAEGDVVWTYAKNAIEGGMAPSGLGSQLMSAQAQIKDIEVASDKFKTAIKDVDKPFTPDQVAKLTLATRTGDEEVARTMLNTVATQNLTEKQQDFVIWMAQLNERAMSLRKVAGQGQGSEDLRNAIRQTIAGVQSGSKEMMLKQVQAFDNQVAILKTGIAHPGKNKGAADMETQEYGGHTYQRKKGSNDQWVLVPGKN